MNIIQFTGANLTFFAVNVVAFVFSVIQLAKKIPFFN